MLYFAASNQNKKKTLSKFDPTHGQLNKLYFNFLPVTKKHSIKITKLPKWGIDIVQRQCFPPVNNVTHPEPC